jgi:serine/threonine-protein kinase
MEPGQTVAGKYRLNRLLGTGGMASVWSATNVFTDREFAIKVMHPQVASTPEAAQRFLKEAKVSARVDHPNVIEVLDVGQAEDGSLFLVMELLNGWSLDAALRRQSPTMTVAELARIMIDVGRALGAAHRSGVVHRDLKPTNIFLHRDKSGVVIPKLLDFGVSKFLEDDRNHALTIAGTVLGSPLYMSPEQARGDTRVDGRTDVFAFGGILFEALTGFRAYDAPNFNALIVSIATKQPKSIDEHAAHVPESLRAVVRDCMVVDRDQRLADMDAVAARLEAALPELDAGTIHLPRPLDAGPSNDPDATAAMQARPSNPPPLASSGSMRPPSLHPSGNFSAPWGTPQPRAAVTGSSRPGAFVPWILGLAGVAVASVAIFGYAAMSRRSTPRAVSATTSATEAPQASAQLTAPPKASNDLPVVNVDSLPVASNKASAPPAKGTGRLSIAASPGWCTVSVDGISKGPTPIAQLDLPAGPHTLKCEPVRGKPKTGAVVIQDGAVSRYKFALDEE